MVALTDLHLRIRSGVERGQMAWCRQACATILDAQPENLETLLLLGELELEGGFYRSATRRFQRVLAGDPEAFLACAGLAIAMEALRDPSAALHWHSRALDLNPSNFEIRRERNRLFDDAYPGRPLPDGLSEFSKARAALDLGRYAEGIDGLKRALELEPGRPEIKVSLAEVFWTCTRPKEASALCWELLNETPQVVKAQALIACIAADQGDVEGGRVLLREVHAQDPFGRIAGHLLAQTTLASLASVPVDIPGPIAPARSDDLFSGELPSWCHWMRLAVWRLLGIGHLEDEAPDDPNVTDPPAEAYETTPWVPSPGPTGVGSLRDADRVMVSEAFQTVDRDALRQFELQRVPAPEDRAPEPSPIREQPPAAETNTAPPEPRAVIWPDPAQTTPDATPEIEPPSGPLMGPSDAGVTPADPTLRPTDPAFPDPDATEIIDEPAWLRARNNLRKGQNPNG